jgi:hypothetical protein
MRNDKPLNPFSDALLKAGLKASTAYVQPPSPTDSALKPKSLTIKECKERGIIREVNREQTRNNRRSSEVDA